MKTKIVSLLATFLLGANVVFADIIDSPYPRPDFPIPEPVDDGEVVVIKVLAFVGILIMITLIAYFNHKKTIKE